MNFILLSKCMLIFENIQAVVLQLNYSFHFIKVAEGSSFTMFSSLWHVDKKKWCVRIHKLFEWVGNVAALDLVVVEEHIRHLHESLMHAILCV